MLSKSRGPKVHNYADLRLLDEDGPIHHVERLTNLNLCPGFKIYPAEVEGVFNTYPDVLQSAVVGRAVPENEEVVAFVEAISGGEIDVDELAACAAARSASYKKPSQLEVLEKLQVEITGKLFKLKLQDMAAGFDEK